MCCFQGRTILQFGAANFLLYFCHKLHCIIGFFGIVVYFLCIAIPFYFFAEEDDSKEEEFHGAALKKLQKLQKKEHENRLTQRKKMVKKANEDLDRVKI